MKGSQVWPCRYCPAWLCKQSGWKAKYFVLYCLRLAKCLELEFVSVAGQWFPEAVLPVNTAAWACPLSAADAGTYFWRGKDRPLLTNVNTPLFWPVKNGTGPRQRSILKWRHPSIGLILKRERRGGVGGRGWRMQWGRGREGAAASDGQMKKDWGKNGSIDGKREGIEKEGGRGRWMSGVKQSAGHSCQYLQWRLDGPIWACAFRVTLKCVAPGFHLLSVWAWSD